MPRARRPAGRFPTTNSNPGIAAPRRSIRCAARSARTRPSRAIPRPIPSRRLPDEPAIAAARERMTRVGLHPFSLPLGVDIDAWLKGGATTWDAFPDTGVGKMDAETCGARRRRWRYPNVDAARPARSVERLTVGAGRQARRRRSNIALAEKRALPRPISSRCAPAPSNRRHCCCRSSERGVANRSGMVGRHFMNHNTTAVIADRSARRSTIRSIRRPSASTTSISTTGAAGRRSATSSCLGA